MNRLTGFLFENKVAHGAFVEISEGVVEMLGHRAYSADVRELIGQAMAAMPLLATHLGFEGRINLQFQGEDAMKRRMIDEKAVSLGGEFFLADEGTVIRCWSIGRVTAEKG